MVKYIKHLINHIWCKLKFGNKCSFDISSYIARDASFEGVNKIYSNCDFGGSMGYGSYIGPNCVIRAHIGRFSSISPYVRTNIGVHPLSIPYATTCPMFFSTRKQNGITFAQKMMFDEIRNEIHIGNDCWIGENVFIVGGVIIGDGAVALAGAVITKDIPPYAIVGGVPAKILRYRYDEDTINFLLRLKWWDKNIKWLREHWDYLCDIERLKSIDVR